MTRPSAKLRILGTTDLHMQVFPYDYYSDRPAPGLGLRQLARLIDEIRRDDEATVLFDNGDFLQGNPLSEAIISNKGTTAPNPMITAMNQLGYDAGCLGNHEFNYGLDQLQTVIEQANFPMTCANISGPDGAFAPRHLMIVRDLVCSDQSVQQIKIGVFGVAPPQVALWDQDILSDTVHSADIVETARHCVSDLRAQGADIIVALCHSGIADLDHIHGQENAIVPVAALDGVDVVLAGHTHVRFPDPAFPARGPIDPQTGHIHETPVVQAGFHGAYLGQIDVSLIWDGAGWTVDQTNVALRKTPSDMADVPSQTCAAIDKLATEHHQKTLEYIRQPVVATSSPVTSHFTMVAADPALQLLADAQRHELVQCCPCKDWDQSPLISAVSPFLAGGRAGPHQFINIQNGQLAFRDVSAIYPFSNTIYAIELSGAALRKWLDRACHVFNVIKPKQASQDLLSPDHASYCFDVFYGLDYRIDLSREHDRVTQLCYQGREVANDEKIVVVTNSYRAHGGGGHLLGLPHKIVCRSEIPVRDALIKRLNSGETITGLNTPPWRFAALGGATARFLTAKDADPGAEPTRDLRRTGRMVDGFAEFEIVL